MDTINFEGACNLLGKSINEVLNIILDKNIDLYFSTIKWKYEPDSMEDYIARQLKHKPTFGELNNFKTNSSNKIIQKVLSNIINSGKEISFASKFSLPIDVLINNSDRYKLQLNLNKNLKNNLLCLLDEIDDSNASDIFCSILNHLDEESETNESLIPESSDYIKITQSYRSIKFLVNPNSSYISTEIFLTFKPDHESEKLELINLYFSKEQIRDFTTKLQFEEINRLSKKLIQQDDVSSQSQQVAKPYSEKINLLSRDVSHQSIMKMLEDDGIDDEIKRAVAVIIVLRIIKSKAKQNVDFEFSQVFQASKTSIIKFCHSIPIFKEYGLFKSKTKDGVLSQSTINRFWPYVVDEGFNTSKGSRESLGYLKNKLSEISCSVEDFFSE